MGFSMKCIYSFFYMSFKPFQFRKNPSFLEEFVFTMKHNTIGERRWCSGEANDIKTKLLMNIKSSNS